MMDILLPPIMDIIARCPQCRAEVPVPMWELDKPPPDHFIQRPLCVACFSARIAHALATNRPLVAWRPIDPAAPVCFTPVLCPERVEESDRGCHDE